MAYNYATGAGGAMSGAMSGAALGSVVPGIGTVLGGVVGGLAGAMGGFGGGDGLQQGYDIVELPQYSWTEPNLRMTGDFLADSMQRLGEGKAPAYWENAVPTLRAGMVDPLRKTYYGRTGERGGLVQQAQTAGAMAGVGPKASIAQMSKQMRDYAEMEQQIDRYLAEQGVNIMNQQSQFLPQMITNMPRGPETAIVNMMGGVSQGGAAGQAGWMPMSDMGSTLGMMGNAGMLPWQRTSMAPNQAGWAMPGVGGYGANTPAGVYNNGTMSVLPGRG